MNEYLNGSGERTLVSLEAPFCLRSRLRTVSMERVARFLESRTAAALWIDAPTGTGKTTTVIHALSASKRFRAIRRIICYRGMRIEEALYWLNDFLLQAGIEDMDKALGQRSRLEAKLSVLFNILATHPVAVFFDDFHHLAIGEDEDSQVSLKNFVSACSSLEQSAPGMLIFTSSEHPPAGAEIERIELPGLSLVETRDLWTLLAAGSDVPHDISNPLLLRLLARMSSSATGRAELERQRENGPDLESAYLKALETLRPATRELLEILAEFGRPLTRGLLRSLCEGIEDKIELSRENTDKRLLELEEYGLLQVSGRDGSTGLSCQLHPFVNDAACQGFHSPDAERIRALRACAANYYLRLPGSSSTWSMYNAREFLLRAGHYEEASQLQKCFIEDLLRLGYHDLAKKILLETIETTSGNIRTVSLGNLAIIYKNDNRYDEALELYEQVRQELKDSGDQANLARVLHQIGNIHYLREDLDAAAAHYEEGGELARELGEEAIWLATRVQFANVLYQCGREDEAMKSYREIVAKLQGSHGEKGTSLLAAMKVQIGQLHQKADRFLEAETEFMDAEKLVRAVDDKRSLLKVLRARAMIARERRAYEEGLSLYDEAQKTAAALGDVLELSTCHLLMGDLERDRVQLGAALKKYTSALSFLESSAPTARLQSADFSRPVASVIDSRLKEMEQLMGEASYQRALAAQTKD
jgi:tetratricopeptide (TPR) repeat protein